MSYCTVFWFLMFAIIIIFLVNQKSQTEANSETSKFNIVTVSNPTNKFESTVSYHNVCKYSFSNGFIRLLSCKSHCF